MGEFEKSGSYSTGRGAELRLPLVGTLLVTQLEDQIASSFDEKAAGIRFLPAAEYRFNPQESPLPGKGCGPLAIPGA
jgi:hypothetical protein